jgi:hypothetical protein
MVKDANGRRSGIYRPYGRRPPLYRFVSGVGEVKWWWRHIE